MVYYRPWHKYRNCHMQHMPCAHSIYIWFHEPMLNSFEIGWVHAHHFRLFGCRCMLLWADKLMYGIEWSKRHLHEPDLYVCKSICSFLLLSVRTLQLDYKNESNINKFESFCLYACDIATCSPGCQHGRCTSPNRCTCNSGWTGRDCFQRECNIPCPSSVTKRLIAT